MEREKQYEALFLRIEELLLSKGRVCVAIDGGAATGKTTLASLLAEKYGGEIVHMDDFFLRPEQRTPERFAEAGGNFDRERFFNEVISSLGKNEPFSYQRFDCATMTLGDMVEVPFTPLLIVEGSYSHHPFFDGYYDLRVFLHISPAEQRKRILERNKEYSDMFFNRWIPLEERYFKTFSIKKQADFVIDV